MAFLNRSQRILSYSKSETRLTNPGEYLDYDNDLNIIEKSQQVYAPFNANANRVTFEIPYDQRMRSIGPGSYENKSNIIKKSFSTKNLDSNTLINQTMFKLIEKTKQMKEINWKKVKNNLRIHHERKPDRAQVQTDKKVVNLKQNRSNMYIKYVQSKNTQRICSIPSKPNFGYDLDKNDNIFLIENPSKEIRYSGEKNDSVSTNKYFIDDKNQDKDKKRIRGLDWSRSSCTKITQGNTNRNNTLINNNATLNNTQTLPISESTSNTNNDYIKEKSFRLFQNVKYPVRGIKKVHSTEHIILEDIMKNTPGPGYYFNQDYKGHKAKKIVNAQDAFGPKAERMILISDYYNNPNLDPGTYNKTRFIPKSVNFHPFVRKEDIVRVDARMNSNPYLGPGSYNPKNVSKKAISLYYGSLDRRFNYNIKDKDTIPGPGEYIELPVWCKKDESPPISYKDQKIVENIKSEVPGIGKYHPDIVSSIDYKIKSKENKLQNFIAPFSFREERFVPTQSIKNIPGPGHDHKEPSKIKLKKALPRMSS